MGKVGLHRASRPGENKATRSPATQAPECSICDRESTAPTAPKRARAKWVIVCLCISCDDKHMSVKFYDTHCPRRSQRNDRSSKTVASRPWPACVCRGEGGDGGARGPGVG